MKIYASKDYVEGKTPQKLSDLENDLYYSTESAILCLTLEDFTYNEDNYYMYLYEDTSTVLKKDNSNIEYRVNLSLNGVESTFPNGTAYPYSGEGYYGMEWYIEDDNGIIQIGIGMEYDTATGVSSFYAGLWSSNAPFDNIEFTLYENNIKRIPSEVIDSKPAIYTTDNNIPERIYLQADTEDVQSNPGNYIGRILYESESGYLYAVGLTNSTAHIISGLVPFSTRIYSKEVGESYSQSNLTWNEYLWESTANYGLYTMGILLIDPDGVSRDYYALMRPVTTIGSTLERVITGMIVTIDGSVYTVVATTADRETATITIKRVL